MEKLVLTKKKTISLEVEPKVELDAEKPKQSFKLLVALAATIEDQLQFQERILEAIKRNLEGYEYDLDVSSEHRLGWNYVVDEFNRVAEKVVIEGYDYLWAIEGDTVPPPDAFAELLSDNVDVAAAVVPFHRYPGNKKLDEVYRQFAIAAWVEKPEELGPLHLYRLDAVRGKKIGSSADEPASLYSGTGCFLVKRGVFESGLRFQHVPDGAGFDMFFWRDVRGAGFSAVLDGCVVCEHLGT